MLHFNLYRNYRFHLSFSILFKKNKILNKVYLIFVMSTILHASSCKKLVEISQPVDTITTEEAFSNEATANAAVVGIYNGLATQGLSFGNGIVTLRLGLSADELRYFFSNIIITPFQNNTLLSDNNDIKVNIWNPAYLVIYRANAAIEGLESSSSLQKSFKNKLLGEAKFIRAFCYFYLVNLFGDVPLVTTTKWSSYSGTTRTPSSSIYNQIVDDLKIAVDLLSDNYSISNNERTRVNKFAAYALLARVNLFLGDFKSAQTNSSIVINNVSMYDIVPANKVFLKNNKEAIWQQQLYNISPFATPEGNAIIPSNSTSNPTYLLTEELVNSFEVGDIRRKEWVDSTIYGSPSTKYHYPKKYRVRVGALGNIQEYYTVLRLAEQYLIRAESRARLNDILGAIDDLNIIRLRATLPQLPTTLTETETFDLIQHERRIELFSEWGHRWLDLKRTKKAIIILPAIKGAFWQPTDTLYPIPVAEIRKNPKIAQNPGYQ